MNGIPIITANGKSIAEAWENSLLLLYKEGCNIKTQYDKPDDPPSKDCTMILTVEEPLSEPMIHRCFPDSIKGLDKYVQNLLYGINADKFKETYTYYDRLFEYSIFDEVGYNQIESIINQLAKTPYSRRAQAITWQVQKDMNDEHSPCLQSIWCRMTADTNGYKEQDNIGLITDIPKWFLNMNIRIRSNDAYHAAFMNIFAFVHLQEYIAKEIQKIINEPVFVGRYCHMADSYHIYGKHMDDFEKRFIANIHNRSFADRTWNKSKFKWSNQ